MEFRHLTQRKRNWTVSPKPLPAPKAIVLFIGLPMKIKLSKRYTPTTVERRGFFQNSSAYPRLKADLVPTSSVSFKSRSRAYLNSVQQILAIRQTKRRRNLKERNKVKVSNTKKAENRRQSIC